MTTPRGPGVDRREFLKGAATVAAGGVAALPALAVVAQRAGAAGPEVLGPGPVPLVLKVNGKDRAIRVEPRTTLLEALRLHCGVTGPKDVCDRGSCGACTVLLDGTAVVSCMALAFDAEGKAITTTEGCSPALHGAFVKADALQCGFCTPGMVTACAGLLARNPDPSAEEVRDAISGNLCRCGTYTRVVEACRSAAASSKGGKVAMAKRKTLAGFKGGTKEIEVEVPDDEPGIWGADANLKVVGTAVPRLDGMAKASGAAVYTADVSVPGMLHGRMLRAAAPGGTLKSVDLSAVEKAPGWRYSRVVAESGAALTHDGRDLAFVVADTEANLEAALLLAKVEIAPGPVVTTEEDAAAEGAPSVIPDRPGNLRGGRTAGQARAFAAAGEAIAKADVVLERTYRTRVQVHTPLETHGFVVQPAENGNLAVHASTQGTFSVVDGVAGALRMKREKVEVVAEFVGGGFGCKFGAASQGSGFGAEAARAAAALNAPIRAMLTRREEHLVGGNRPSSIQKVRLGVNRDGTVLGYTAEIRGSAGFAEGGAGAANPMIYDLGAKAKEEITVLTHAGPAAAFRAPGHPQGSFALESALDEAADAIGMDPLEFRLRLDRNPVRLAQYRLGSERFGWKEKRSAAPGSGTGPLKRGVGMGSCTWFLGGGPGSAVDVTVHRDGSVEVSNGAQDIGTGTRTVLAVIVAEVLGLDPAGIRVNLGRTRWPAGPGSGGSVTAPTLGPCARAAAEKARAGVLGAAPPGDPAVWKAACARMDGEKTTFSGTRGKNYGAFSDGIAGVQFAQVEVDTETGVVRVLRVLAIQDCGRVIDRLTAESQVIGGVIQGISYALFEDRVLDRKTGRLLHGDLEGYRIAGSKDTPDIEAVMFEVANAANSVGMTGLGEPPTIPTAGAVANAVAHATGARVRELPITPARVLAALAAKGGK